MSNILHENSVVDLNPDVHPEQARGETLATSAEGRKNDSSGEPAGEPATLRGILNAAETQVILQALEHTGWNRKRAAALLKISYRGLLYKIRSHSITKPMAGDSAGD
ncbi:MAG TPA: helix-turn-helix domain-containing protein [Terriglobales bacterium]|nr:helix-turn-helix domain-containing protein [Terriglobales bacterium]